MAKYLVRLLVSLSILISSGYSAVYANMANENAIEGFSSSFENSVGLNNTSQHPLSYSDSKEHGNDIFIVNNSKVEEEDDDFVSSNLLENHFFTALQIANIFGFLFDDLAEDIHFSKFIPDASTLRIHVLIQVFRI